MNDLPTTATDLAARALEASWTALTALETDVMPHVQEHAHDVACELTEAIVTRAIFGESSLELVEQVLDDLAERIIAGTRRTTRYDVHSVSGGTWVETTRTEQAEGFARATTVLLDFQAALRAVLDRVEAERAVARLLATG